MTRHSLERRIEALESVAPPPGGDHTYVVDIASDDPQYLIDGQEVSRGEFVRRAPAGYEVDITP